MEPDTIYIPTDIALFFGLEFDQEEPGPDGYAVVSVTVEAWREALLAAAGSR